MILDLSNCHISYHTDEEYYNLCEYANHLYDKNIKNINDIKLIDILTKIKNKTWKQITVINFYRGYMNAYCVNEIINILKNILPKTSIHTIIFGSIGYKNNIDINNFINLLQIQQIKYISLDISKKNLQYIYQIDKKLINKIIFTNYNPNGILFNYRVNKHISFMNDYEINTYIKNYNEYYGLTNNIFTKTKNEDENIYAKKLIGTQNMIYLGKCIKST